MHALQVRPAGQGSALLGETPSRQGHSLSRTVMDSSEGSPVATLTLPTLESVAARTESPIVHRAMAFIAVETAIELTELSDETDFSSIGLIPFCHSCWRRIPQMNFAWIFEALCSSIVLRLVISMPG